ncbi:hypothetical protein TSAR_002941, partial [Trichomalopsis sarcophagae]
SMGQGAMARSWTILIGFCLLGWTSAAKVSSKESSVTAPCLHDTKFYRNSKTPAHAVWTPAECAKYYLCLDNEVFEFKCSQGLLFDVSRQICDFKANVDNCDVILEEAPSKPLLENGNCEEGHLACGDASCILSQYFCDGNPDCPDGSDEAFCELFTDNRKNPNGCPIRATFYVSHQYTNYRDVQQLWNLGHEIAVHSVTHRGPEDWWMKNATLEDWFDEMVGEANIINRFAGVRMEDMKGLRVPFLRVGWNRQFLMMQEFGFVYDSSIVAPPSNPPIWPYTLDYQPPYGCTAVGQLCPTRSYQGIWEIPINPLFVEDQHCQTLETCSINLNEDEIYGALMNNFKMHYSSNRAPLGLHFQTSWLQTPSNYLALSKFIDDVLRLPDVYFVSNQQVLEWMRNPTSLDHIRAFKPWHCFDKKFDTYEIVCDVPNTCKLPSRILKTHRYLHTCYDCPKQYPWLRNEFGHD